MLTRASCQPACAPSCRATAASRAARPPPNRSISQPACSAPCTVVAIGSGGCELLRLACSAPSSVGSSAAPAAMRLARALAIWAWAWATVGLADCAAAIRSASSGSPWPRHHCTSAASLPWCGTGAAGGSCACQAGGLALSGAGGGAGANAQPASRVATAVRTQQAGAVRIMAVASDEEPWRLLLPYVYGRHGRLLEPDRRQPGPAAHLCSACADPPDGR